MPIGGFVGSSVEKETIVLKRALLEIEETTLNYGDDPDNPAPFDVTDDSGKTKFTSNPYINGVVRIVDDYSDGSCDDKRFYDKFFLVYDKKSDAWKVSRDGKLGFLFRAHPKYGDKAFEEPVADFDENDLKGLQFEAATEQREDNHGAKIPGTRIAFKTIGPVPNRDKKKRGQTTPAKDDLTEADLAEMNAAIQ